VRRRLIAAGAALLGICATLSLLTPPLPATLEAPPWSSAVFSADGTLLDVQIARDEQWRLPAPELLPPKYVQALLAFEDRHFYEHPGINPVSVARALLSNARNGRVVSGASTISMQVARLARNNPPRTYLNKLREMLLVFRIESRYSKDEILKLYATHAPFGGNVVGLQAASWPYFGRAPHDLSWAEAALLAVLPNSPGLLHPGRNRDALLRKRDRLLATLHEQKLLSATDYQLALLEPLPDKARAWPALAPHLLQHLLSRAPRQARFDTTIDERIQRDMLGMVQAHGRGLAEQGVHNLALLVLDHRRMTTIAYIGNHATAADGADVDIARSPRSTGSVLKPLLYGLMLQEGEILPTTLIPDVPSHFGSYAPENFDGQFRGAVPAREALAQSLNVPAVRMLSRYGVTRFRERLHAFGLTSIERSAENYGLSLILGGAEASLWELTALYANLMHVAAQWERPGMRHAVLLEAAEAQPAAATEFPLQAGAAWLTLNAMIDVVRPGADSIWRDFEASQVIAWKTGTSYGLRDGWAIGSNGRYTVGVWTGNADGAPAATLGGAQSAGPILMDAFALLGNDGWLAKPFGALKEVRTCADNGYLVNRDCAQARVQAPAEANFTSVSPHHQRVFLSADGRFRVHSGCESPARMVTRDWFVLPPVQEYFWKRRHSEYRALPPWRSDCIEGLQQQVGELPFELIYPDSDNALYLPLELSGTLGEAVFRAVHRDPAATLHWHLDARYLGATTLYHEQVIRAAPGRHTLVLVDQDGQRLERRFSVLGPLEAGGQ
jgi:penicillin-binding protein 1C